MKSSSGKRRKNNLLKMGLLAAGVGLAAGIWGLSPPEEILPPPMLESQNRFSDPTFGSVGPKTGPPSLIEKGEGVRVDLNAAALSDLMTLPGVGEKTAQRIIEYRIEHGNYSSIDSVMKVHGIGPEKFKKIIPYIMVK